MGRSLMEASLKRISPFSSNSQFSLPYERNQFPESSCHRSIELQSPLVVENVRGNCSSRSGRKSKVPAFHSCRCGKALFRIRVSEQSAATHCRRCGEVPVSIDELLNGIGADRSERICKLRTRAGEACIN